MAWQGPTRCAQAGQVKVCASRQKGLAPISVGELDEGSRSDQGGRARERHRDETD